MAPLSKESETALSSNAAPPAPPLKAPEAGKPQPVAIEIPVTINGAHTVNGSGKREPFSESTTTVLLFAHGAVVRMATPLAPGQLVFVTNEKTKKEIVCQAVKSKAGGSSTYVELKFTEPAPGFWGIRTQAGDTPIPSTVVAPKTSVPPIVVKSQVVKESAPLTPPAVIAAPAVSVVSPPPVIPPAPIIPSPPTASATSELPSLTSALLQAAPKSVPSLTGSSPVAHSEPVSPKTPLAANDAPVSSTLSASAEPGAPAVSAEPDSQLPVPTFKDFSKEIDALFGLSTTPSANTPAPGSITTESKEIPTPSSQELRVHAAELQSKLSSLLFETPASSPEPEKSPIEASKQSTTPAQDGLAAKLLEFAQEQPAPFVKSEPAPVAEAQSMVPPATAPLVPKPVLPSISADDEVKIPAWLAPLSQNSATSASAPAAAGLASETSLASASATEQGSETHTEVVHRSQASVFGGQLTGEVDQTPATTGRSKTGLLLTLAAAAILLVAAAAWYFLYGPGAPTNASTHPTHTTTSVQQPNPVEPQVDAQPPATHALEAAPSVSKTNPGPANLLMASPLPSKTSSVDASPAVFKSAPEHRAPNVNPPVKEVAPTEPVKKPALGDVHLAAPVVNRGNAQTVSDAEPAIATSAPDTGADAATSLMRSKSPVAPLPVGGDVKPAQLTKSVPPQYPAIAKSQHIFGNVQIDALVDASGNVAEARAIGGPQLLYRAALDAVKQWKYAPATLNGEPTSMHLTVVVQFRAQ